MSTNARKLDPGDLTDEQWNLIADLIPAPRPGSRPRVIDMREVLKAILNRRFRPCSLWWTLRTSVGMLASLIVPLRPV